MLVNCLRKIQSKWLRYICLFSGPKTYPLRLHELYSVQALKINDLSRGIGQSSSHFNTKIEHHRALNWPKTCLAPRFGSLP